MAKPYSQDLRDRVVRAVLAGQSRRKAARSFDISASCVIKLMQQWETTGDCLPRKFGGHKRHALAEHEDKVRALVAAQPDLTITALWKKLTVLDIKVGRSAVGRFLLHLKLTYKKTLHAAEQERPDVQAARLAWREMQKGLDPKKLVFIDETWASTRAVQRSIVSPFSNGVEEFEAQRRTKDSLGRKSLNLCEATESFGGCLEVIRTFPLAARNNPRSAARRRQTLPTAACPAVFHFRDCERCQLVSRHPHLHQGPSATAEQSL